jgi:hypothetical protein
MGAWAFVGGWLRVAVSHLTLNLPDFAKHSAAFAPSPDSRMNPPAMYAASPRSSSAL